MKKPNLSIDALLTNPAPGLVIGFVGWFVINSLLWFPNLLTSCSLGLLCPLPNVVVLITVALKRRWIASGIALAYGANFFAWIVVPILTHYDRTVAFINSITGLPIILPLLAGYFTTGSPVLLPLLLGSRFAS
jgi:hypothetical protein